MARTPLASIRIDNTTTLAQLEQFQKDIGQDGAKLRGKQHKDGSITLKAVNRDSSFLSKMTGHSRKRRDVARTALTQVMTQTGAADRKPAGSLQSLINANRASSPRSAALGMLIKFAQSENVTEIGVKTQTREQDVKTNTYKGLESRQLNLTELSTAATRLKTAISDGTTMPSHQTDALANRIATSLVQQLDVGNMSLNDRSLLGASDVQGFLKGAFAEALQAAPDGALADLIDRVSSDAAQQVSDTLLGTSMTSADSFTIGDHTYVKVATLGSGAFGKAELFHCEELDKEVVLKTGRMDFANMVEEDRYASNLDFMTEIDLHTQIKTSMSGNHPANVLSLEGVVKTPEGALGIITEACTGGEAGDAMGAIEAAEKAGTLDHDQAMTLKLTLLRDMAQGLSDMHASGFSHRDVKLRNVFVDGSGNGKVADFGESSASLQLNLANEREIENAVYKAPEAITARDAALEADADLKKFKKALNQGLGNARLQVMNNLFGNTGLTRGIGAGMSGKNNISVDSDVPELNDPAMMVARDLTGDNLQLARQMLQADKNQVRPDASIRGDSADVWSFGTSVLEQFAPPKSLITSEGWAMEIVGKVRDYGAQKPTPSGTDAPPIPAPRPLSAGGFMVADFQSPHDNNTVTGDAELDRLLNQTLARDPANRPGFAQIVANPVFQRDGVGSAESRAVLAALLRDPPADQNALQQLAAQM